ncbi:MAG TPA: CRISPR-associated helicase Cas3' [Kiritimatiellia bacterium]|nr:CRISPR-associated helicase Cas3' [Kiritimatiellia bacterium]HMO98732.1 CRISPR-associated helicase Cas3' [Kiritimatiellia bacterium]HMP96892.1 CRISPR-associated helicase Cas3' [Kiritimatiellia bacterium]
MKSRVERSMAAGSIQDLYAHSLKDQPVECWQKLEDHLRQVAELAAAFAKPFGASDWALVSGWWHDLGKYAQAFQNKLLQQDDAAHVDHSTAGAQYAVRSAPVLGNLLAYIIAGHHGGLSDAIAEGACLQKRLKKNVDSWEHGLRQLPPLEVPESLPLPSEPFATAFFTRMVFSCLVDADFLDTEDFMDPARKRQRVPFPTIGTLHDRFFQTLENFDPQLPINRIRAVIRRHCEEKAELPPGFFSLTVPTGGGKTLSALAFALKHTRLHELDRIVYVAPFTSIIEQNAQVFRDRLGKDAVLEHHCNTDPQEETAASRLAAENWDASLIVTTSVQFYDSLFSNRPSACRKLHNLARSIIILDEAQTLPVHYLKPCLAALKELVARYGCSVLLCTATQPAILKRNDFDIGLESVREIMDDPPGLYQSLKRVRVQNLGRKSDEELVACLAGHERVLCIVNTTGHAQKLFERLGRSNTHFHLSARMCPAHRAAKLQELRARLDDNQPCKLVSTQVVEAGVDIDFPVVYRSMAGLDSIAQAAGRCNRNGRLEYGEVFLFQSEHTRSEQYFRDTAQCAEQVMALYSDPLDLSANEHFFRLYYWNRVSQWDARHILDNFRFGDRKMPFVFGFEKTAHDFHLIDDAATCGVIVPWGDEGRILCERLWAMPEPGRDDLRVAQRYIVQVRKNVWDRYVVRDIKLVYDNLGILVSPETHYSEETGLNLEAEGPGSYFG